MFSQRARRYRMRAVRLMFSVVLVLLGLLSIAHGQKAEPAAPVYWLELEDTINPGSAGLLQHAIDSAATNNAQLLVVQINTPGGLLSSTREMVASISNAPVPVAVYVGPTGAGATSAGAFILLSAHVAAMNTGTTVGASSPVAGDGSDIQGTMAKKVMNDTRALMRGIAESRGRNTEVAETLVSDAASFTAEEALGQNLIDITVDNPGDLLVALDGRQLTAANRPQVLQTAGVEPVVVEPRLMDRLLRLVAHPQIAHLLISLGMLAIYIEFVTPGLALPGVIGGVAIVLGLIGVNSLPANTGFMILMLLGVAFMLAEYMVGGSGVLGIGGAVAFVLGSLNLFDLPADQGRPPSLIWVSIGASAAVVLTSVWITRAMRLKSPDAGSVVGKAGEAMVSFTGEGHVLVDGHRWLAVSDEPLEYGDRVVVVEQSGADKVRVKKQRPDNGV